MKKASIDLGTNTCLLLVAEVDSAGRVTEVLHDESTMVRLGQDVDRLKELQAAPMERTLQCLSHYRDIVRRFGIPVESVVAVATASARDSRNGAQFFDRVHSDLGFSFRVLSGQEEARAMFYGGMIEGLNPKRLAVIDIGGGSTEFRTEKEGISLQLGSVRMTERFFKSDPVEDREFWAARDSIEEGLQEAIHWRKRQSAHLEWVGVAGTVVNIAQWHLRLDRFDATQLHGLVLSRGDIHRAVEEFKWRSNLERSQLVGIEKGRAEVILAGSLILWRSMELLGVPSLRVSTRGLRYGVFSL